MMWSGGMCACVDVKRRCVCIRVGPPRSDECLRVLIGRLDVTVLLAKARLRTRVPCEMSKLLACLRRQLIARERISLFTNFQIDNRGTSSGDDEDNYVYNGRDRYTEE